ncbi:MAG: hypothetical protein COV70_01670 [Parcubacteria group bacterium CG11_big_fil_rev_8_21_14_0_20_39_22]|nr:MAG: hypothetical protein COV70_01670 [Parcubacteria group bacterium CG11_big_fil_rev_8_21_14_0_20_39_22]
MDQEERELLRRTAKLAQENNQMLKKMRRSAFFGKLLHLFYWVVIIGLSVAVYYYVEPYVRTGIDLYGEAGQKIQELRELQ